MHFICCMLNCVKAATKGEAASRQKLMEPTYASVCLSGGRTDIECSAEHHTRALWLINSPGFELGYFPVCVRGSVLEGMIHRVLLQFLRETDDE